jgi:molybdenum cofactor synthesis domain-containing protein
MEVAILTVGDEVLAGDTENTNATWLAGRLTDAGATVTRILTVPDDRAVIRETVETWREAFDAVIVTGGLGGTHDVHESFALVQPIRNLRFLMTT